MKSAHPWYEGKTGNHQGLVIEEGTGRNIAVTYDKDDAPLVAAAPELLEVVRLYLELAPHQPKNLSAKAWAAIAKVEEPARAAATPESDGAK